MPGLTFSNWNGIVMPAGVPEDVVAMWRQAVSEICADEEFVAEMSNIGIPISYQDGAEWGPAVLDSVDTYQQMAEDLGLRN